MEFKKYPSITNSYQAEFLEKVSLYNNETKWFVQEKVHGANFAIYSDGNEVKCAKRTSFVDCDERFYNHPTVMEKYAKSVMHIARRYGEVIVYGELCGGAYDGQYEGKMIQRGVQYCPHNDFLIFDIMANGEFMRFESVIEIARDYDLNICPVLISGPLEDCLKYPNEFPSIVPELFNLPIIANNICEGVVIRPNQSIFFGESRIILKNKNSIFSEKDERPIKLTQEFPEELQPILDEITPYINENRVLAVASKIGEVSINDFQKLMGLTIQDAIEEAGDIAYKKLEPILRKPVNKELQRHVIPLVRNYFGMPA